MSNHGKRKGFVDLTGDDEKLPPSKHARVNQSGSASQPSASQSLNSSSQNSRDAWGNDEENEIIDLSQDVDEGMGWVCVGGIGT